MTDIERFAQDDPALDVLRPGTIEDGKCVLLWVQRAQRAHANLAVNTAVELANEHELPVIALFCLVPGFPEATLRTYHFMAEGLAELPDAFAGRGIGWRLEVGEPKAVIPKITKSLGAAVIVTDINPLQIGREWRAAVAEGVRVPMLAVDADVVVPSSLFPKEEYAPRTIRPKLRKQLDQYLVRIPDTRAKIVSEIRTGPDPLKAIEKFDLDTSVGVAPDLRGGSKEARKRLKTFVEQRLAKYDKERSRADIDAGTGLSPWLHYGQIGPTEIALAVQAADAPEPAKESLLDELITHRELAINFALRNPDYDAFKGLPDWGRETLAKHASDPRDPLFTPEEFEQAQTEDRLWNAAMTQLFNEGWMPNRLRMYWAKQILRWSADPEEAWKTAIHLNNRYFVDGRDANSWANVAWSIGGRHDRPFGPEKPIFGLVRPMGMGAMKRTFDVEEYIRKIEERWGAIPASSARRSSGKDED